MHAEEVSLEILDAIAVVTINRPGLRNAMNVAAWTSLAANLDRVEKETRVRVLLLRGAGDRAFVSGADIAELSEIAGSKSRARTYVELVESVMARLEALPQPVIALAKGHAIGAGLELMAACDLRIASETARFGIPAAKLGIAISGQDLLRLERLVGIGRVKWLLMTGRLIGAEQALAWGMVDAVYPSGDFDEQARLVASEVSDNSSITHQLTKQALRSNVPWRQLDHEAGLQSAAPAWTAASLREGIDAFLERRPPRFVRVESQQEP